MRLVGSVALALSLLAVAAPAPTSSACAVDLTEPTAPRVSTSCVQQTANTDEPYREIALEVTTPAFRANLDVTADTQDTSDPLQVAFNGTHELEAVSVDGSSCQLGLFVSTQEQIVDGCNSFSVAH